MAISKERLKILERRAKWAEANPAAYVAKEVAGYLCFTFGVALLMFIVLTPHPQHIQVTAHCSSLNFTSSISYAGINNCTIEANATVWISEEQFVVNKIGLP